MPLEKQGDGPEEVALHLVGNHTLEPGFRKVIKFRLDGLNKPAPLQVFFVSSAPGAWGALKGLQVPNGVIQVDEVSSKQSLKIANFGV